MINIFFFVFYKNDMHQTIAVITTTNVSFSAFHIMFSRILVDIATISDLMTFLSSPIPPTPPRFRWIKFTEPCNTFSNFCFNRLLGDIQTYVKPHLAHRRQSKTHSIWVDAALPRVSRCESKEALDKNSPHGEGERKQAGAGFAMMSVWRSSVFENSTQSRRTLLVCLKHVFFHRLDVVQW